MRKYIEAIKEAKAAFKMSIAVYKGEMACKRNLDIILDAYAIMPEYMRGGKFKEYVLSEIVLFETVYHTNYPRKEEIVNDDCCDDITLTFADDGSITVAEEIEEAKQ